MLVLLIVKRLPSFYNRELVVSDSLFVRVIKDFLLLKNVNETLNTEFIDYGVICSKFELKKGLVLEMIYAYNKMSDLDREGLGL